MAKKSITRPYDAASYLKSEEDYALYFQAAIDESEGDPAVVVMALGDIARARGMSDLAKETGLTREGLYKALSPEGNPSFATVIKVCDALGLKLHAQATNGRGDAHERKGTGRRKQLRVTQIGVVRRRS